MAQHKETIIIATGGSLLIPDQIDVDFIKDLKDLIRYFNDQSYQIVLVVGGGKVCRRYQAAARNFDNVSDTDLDWIGIKTIRLNCELLLRAYSDLDVHEEVIERWQDIEGIRNDLVIVGAWKPGCSSDTDAVEMAKAIKAERIINFSNTSHVYSDDPRTNPDAEKFSQLSWQQYRNLIPKEWSPGLSAPFDPIASKRAEELGLTVAILGASTENLRRYLNNEPFEGTIIS